MSNKLAAALGPDVDAVRNDLQRRRELKQMTKPELVTYALNLENKRLRPRTITRARVWQRTMTECEMCGESYASMHAAFMCEERDIAEAKAERRPVRHIMRAVRDWDDE